MCKQILILHSDETMGAVLRAILSGDGHEVQTDASLSAAGIEKRGFDLILADHCHKQLPLARRAPKPRVILLTRGSANERLPEHHAALATGFSLAELRAAVAGTNRTSCRRFLPKLLLRTLRSLSTILARSKVVAFGFAPTPSVLPVTKTPDWALSR
jgi:hypothetical protein